MLAATESRRERALLQLDVYRRMVEGQLRPWAWTLLRLLGPAGTRMPEISQLRDQLIASKNRIAVDAAARMLVAARNAAAHEDYAWDATLGALLVGDAAITVEDLEAETNRAYALMCGAETGWAFARAESDELGFLLDVGRTAEMSAILSRPAASAYFGTNGLRITRWAYEETTLSVELEQLEVWQVNPCIQATMWAAQHLPEVMRFTVSLPSRRLPVIDVHRDALDAVIPLWMPARRWFDAMPPAVFIPVLAAARTAIESTGRAADAAVWLALNSALHAYNDLSEEGDAPETARLQKLSRLLELSAESLRATASVLPGESETLLGRPLRVLHSAAVWMASRARGDDFGASALLEARIRAMHAALVVPAVLPTLDTTPIG